MSASAVGQVEVLGGLVEHEHGEVGEQRAGQRQPLPLAAGEPRPVLADEGVEPVGQRRRPSPAAGPARARRRSSSSVALRPGEPQVLPHGAVEEVRVLGAQPDEPPDVVAVQRVRVHTAERVRPLPASRKRSSTCASVVLPEPDGADHGDPAARGQGEVDAGERVPLLPGVPGAQPLARRAGTATRARRRGCSGSRTGTGASRTSYTRSALRVTRCRYCTASGSPMTASKAASGVRTTTARATPSSRPSRDRLHARRARRRTTVSPQTSAESPAPSAVAVAAREAIRVSTRVGLPRLARCGAGSAPATVSSAVPVSRSATRVASAPRAGASRRSARRAHGPADQRYADPGGEQPDGEHGPGLGQQPGGEPDGRRGHDDGAAPGGQQPAQPVVLQGVHVGDEPGQQVAAPGRAAARRARAAPAAGRRRPAVSASIRSTASCETSRSAYRKTARPIPKARVAVTATIR